MALKFTARDISGFKLLFFLAIMYGLMSLLAYNIIHMNFINPLDVNAPKHRFSEARAIEHVRVLAQDGRQVSFSLRVFFFNSDKIFNFYYICSTSHQNLRINTFLPYIA